MGFQFSKEINAPPLSARIEEHTRATYLLLLQDNNGIARLLSGVSESSHDFPASDFSNTLPSLPPLMFEEIDQGGGRGEGEEDLESGTTATAEDRVP